AEIGNRFVNLNEGVKRRGFWVGNSDQWFPQMFFKVQPVVFHFQEFGSSRRADVRPVRFRLKFFKQKCKDRRILAAAEADGVYHAGTFAISRAYVRRLPTMASTKESSRAKVWRFTSPSLSLHANSSMYRE